MVPGTNLGYNYYKALSYGGLFQIDEQGKITTQTDIFQKLVPEKDRQSIADKLFNEQYANKNPKGTKCK